MKRKPRKVRKVGIETETDVFMIDSRSEKETGCGLHSER